MTNKQNYEQQTTNNKLLTTFFRNYLKTLGYSKSAVHNYPMHVAEFLQQHEKNNSLSLGESWRGVQSHDIQNHYQYLLERPNKTKPGALSISTISGHILAIKHFFRWLQETGEITKNPSGNIHFPSPEYNHRTALTQQEIMKLYQSAETLRDRAILSLFYGCGLRVSEAEKLNIHDIKFRENILIVRHSKGGKSRLIPLAEKVKEDLENYYYNERQQYTNNYSPQKVESEGVAFILNNRGNRMTRNSYRPRLKYLLEKSGIQQEICIHQLRHSIATHLLQQGMKIEKVRDFLGHKHIDTTQRYTHLGI